MQIVIPSFTYSPYIVPRLFFFFTDVDFLFILRKEDTWLVWKLIRSLVHLKSLFLNSTCKYVMSINLETAEKLVLCVITQGVGFLLQDWRMRKSQSPAQNPPRDDQPKEDQRSGIFLDTFHVPFHLSRQVHMTSLQWFRVSKLSP